MIKRDGAVAFYINGGRVAEIQTAPPPSGEVSVLGDLELRADKLDNAIFSNLSVSKL
jgi:hypothetical protein